MKKKFTINSQSRGVTVHSHDVLPAQSFLSSTRKGLYHYYLGGAGSVLDVGGTGLKAPKAGSIEEDSAKLKEDFAKIGKDLRSVFLTQVDRLG